jgi:hypothetical protein
MESQGGNELYYGTGSTMATTMTRLTNFERWNTEQIGDFVRKLGFLDKEKDKGEGDKIKHFLHVNEVHAYMHVHEPYPRERGPTTECRPTPHFWLNSLLRSNVYSNMRPCVSYPGESQLK